MQGNPQKKSVAHREACPLFAIVQLVLGPHEDASR
jgi:hypothetical protein